MLQTGAGGSTQVLGGRMRKAGYPTERSRQGLRFSQKESASAVPQNLYDRAQTPWFGHYAVEGLLGGNQPARSRSASRQCRIELALAFSVATSTAHSSIQR